LTLDEGGRVGSLTITQRALESAGASPDHAEGFVDFPRSIQGVMISILYSELPDGRFKLSLRSKGTVNVAQIAGVFGGGGHINAAACRMEGNIDTIHRRVLEAIRNSGEL
jgi:phosphoesterase RecJ-like protein